MTTLMRIDSSLNNTENSISRQLGDFLETQLQPTQTIHHDLAQQLPQAMGGDYVSAMYTPEPNTQQQTLLQESDLWIQQLKNADAILITVPMYNFGLPAHLKSFFDRILRVGHTFKYGENGPQGLLQDKPVYLIVTSGGDYRQGPASAMNYLDGHLKVMLNFIGLTKLHFFHAVSLAQGAADSIKQAAKQDIMEVLSPSTKEKQSA